MSRPSLDSTRSLHQHRQMSIALRKFSAVDLWIALFALVVSIPFSEPLRAGVLIESILISIVLISAIFTVAASRRALLIAVVLALPTLAGRWIHQFRPDVMPPELFLIGGILLVLFLIFNLFRFVLSASPVNTEVLCPTTSAYFLPPLPLPFRYWLLSEIVSNPFLSSLAHT